MGMDSTARTRIWCAIAPNSVGDFPRKAGHLHGIGVLSFPLVIVEPYISTRCSENVQLSYIGLAFVRSILYGRSHRKARCKGGTLRDQGDMYQHKS